MKKFDFIIVGQGLAGSLIAWFAEQAGKSVFVIDNKHQKAASGVAAGIMNPITGRRFVKSWRFDELMAFAQKTYRQIEYHFDVPLFYKRNILRVLFSNKEENDWNARSVQADYAPHIVSPQISEIEGILNPFFSIVEIDGSAQLDIPLLLKTLQKRLRHKKQLLETKLDYTKIDLQKGKVIYEDVQADAMIFCEGYQAQHNPYFNFLPFVPAKGEVLLVKIPEYASEKMLKHRLYVVPMGNDLYWVGATNEWDFDTDQPTNANKADLLRKLQEAIHAPFEVVAHRAAIRPTVKDRRPFLGRHPIHPELLIFNGFGTKGASLAPFWAKHLCDHLLHDIPLDEAVNIARFGANTAATS